MSKYFWLANITLKCSIYSVFSLTIPPSYMLLSVTEFSQFFYGHRICTLYQLIHIIWLLVKKI